MTGKKIPCITLLTDFGHKDHFVGAMKGAIQSICPGISVIDICHEIPPQDIKSCAFLLMCAYSYFPKNTLHVAVVDPGVGSKRKIILVKTKNYYFLAPDNGLLSYVLEREEIKNVTEITNEKYWLKTISRTFHGRDIFAPVAAELAKGVPPGKFGKTINACELNLFHHAIPRIKKDGCVGEILYCDHFGNLITNIEQKILRGKTIKEITLKGKHINKIADSYAEGKHGEIIGLFGSTGFLEIACVNGNAQKKLHAKTGDKVIAHLKSKGWK